MNRLSLLAVTMLSVGGSGMFSGAAITGNIGEDPKDQENEHEHQSALEEKRKTKKRLIVWSDL